MPSVSCFWVSLHGMSVFLLLFIIHPSPFFISVEVQWCISHDCKNFNSSQVKLFFSLHIFSPLPLLIERYQNIIFFFYLSLEEEEGTQLKLKFRNHINFHWCWCEKMIWPFSDSTSWCWAFGMLWASVGRMICKIMNAR